MNMFHVKKKRQKQKHSIHKNIPFDAEIMCNRSLETFLQNHWSLKKNMGIAV